MEQCQCGRTGRYTTSPGYCRAGNSPGRTCQPYNYFTSLTPSVISVTSVALLPLSQDSTGTSTRHVRDGLGHVKVSYKSLSIHVCASVFSVSSVALSALRLCVKVVRVSMPGFKISARNYVWRAPNFASLNFRRECALRFVSFSDFGHLSPGDYGNGPICFPGFGGAQTETCCVSRLRVLRAKELA